MTMRSRAQHRIEPACLQAEPEDSGVTDPPSAMTWRSGGRPSA
ncbi:hypothetical protein ACFV3O_07395 [Streptomyces albidoflavus]